MDKQSEQMKYPLLLALCLVLTSSLEAQDLLIPPTLSVEVARDSMQYDWRSADDPIDPAMFGNAISLGPEPVRYGSERKITFLPAIFFDQGSAELPRRYRTFSSPLETTGYRADEPINLSTWPGYGHHAKYYDVMNVLGVRLREEEDLSLEIEGTWSTEANESRDLAVERARRVREYLTEVWGIDSSRVPLRQPVRACDSTAPFFVQEESRSVRMYPNHWSAIRPVAYRAYHAASPFLFFHIRCTPTLDVNRIREIRFEITCADTLLGTTDLPLNQSTGRMEWTGEWFLPVHVDSTTPPLLCTLFILPKGGPTRRSNSVEIPIYYSGDQFDGRTDCEESISEALSVEDLREYYPESSPEELDSIAASESRFAEFESLRCAMDPYSSVPFYYWGDTTLNSVQQLIATMYIELRKELRRVSYPTSAATQPFSEVMVVADCDETESPTADMVTLMQKFEYLRRPYTPKPFSPRPLFFMPEGAEDWDWEDLQSERLTQVYGVVESQESMEAREEYFSLFNPNYQMNRREQLMVDSFLTARARSAVSWLKESYPDVVDSIVIGHKYLPDYRYGQPMNVSFARLPEDRLYLRTVEIRVRY